MLHNKFRHDLEALQAVVFGFDWKNGADAINQIDTKV